MSSNTGSLVLRLSFSFIFNLVQCTQISPKHSVSQFCRIKIYDSVTILIRNLTRILRTEINHITPQRFTRVFRDVSLWIWTRALDMVTKRTHTHYTAQTTKRNKRYYLFTLLTCLNTSETLGEILKYLLTTFVNKFMKIWINSNLYSEISIYKSTLTVQFNIF